MGLTTQQVAKLRAELGHLDQTPVGLVKSDMTAAIEGLDAELDAQATTLNNALPAAYKAAASTDQKAELLARITLAAWGGSA